VQLQDPYVELHVEVFLQSISQLHQQR